MSIDKNFMDIVFQIDSENSLLEQKKILSMHMKCLLQCLVKAKDDWINLSIMLKVMAQFDISPPVSFQIAPSQEFCEKIEAEQKKINESFAKIHIDRARKLYVKAKTGKEVEKYLDRHRYSEKAIRLALEILQEGESQPTWPYEKLKKAHLYTLISRCYLLRSKLALAKGSDVPEKKLEALKKAQEFCCLAEKASPVNRHGIGDLKMEIALERTRWETHLPPNWFEVCFETFNSLNLDPQNPIHRAANDRLSLSGLNIFPDTFDAQLLTLDRPLNDPFFYLHQANAAKRSGIKNLRFRIKRAVIALNGIPLSHPLWDDTVNLICSAKKENDKGWMDAAIAAWRYCRKEESRLKLGIQIRWYWSRQAALYDAAFGAAKEKNNPLLAAQIADSLKSRPAIKLIQAENSLYEQDRKTIRTYQKIETHFATGSYQTGLEEAKKMRPSKSHEDKFVPPPSGWTALHFYIARNETGYVILINNTKTEVIPICICETWMAYKEWKEDLIKCGSLITETEGSLKKLCTACGKMLSHVIKATDETNLIFVPHGFLHLVPLHASLIDERPLFMDKTSLFLPAWSLAPTQPRYNQRGKGALITCWDEGKDLKDFIDHPIWKNNKILNCSPQDYVSLFNQPNPNGPLDLLTFYCHGRGDFQNPYQSGLKLHKDREGFLTHQAIIHNTPKGSLAGTKVIVTACESDMTSGHSSMVDEHLSIAAAFLRKGAIEVCGTLFKCDTEIAAEIIKESICCATTLYETVHKVQRIWYSNQLWQVAPYRVMGYPYEKKGGIE